jgi:tRNA(fMet)-specific endonuclease VapC
MQYMLDTDICSFVIHRRARHERIIDRLDGRTYGQLLISAITLAELRYMIANAGNPPSKLTKVVQFLLRFRIEAFEEDAAAEYGILRVALKHEPIGPYALLIAAHARSLGAVLVSNNVSQFRRVPGLQVENWVEDGSPPAS